VPVNDVRPIERGAALRTGVSVIHTIAIDDVKVRRVGALAEIAEGAIVIKNVAV
jgi:hypothetical protein